MNNKEYLELYNSTPNSFTREHILMELRSKHDRLVVMGRCISKIDNKNHCCWLVGKRSTTDIVVMIVSMNIEKDHKIVNIKRMYDIETFESKFKVV